MKPSLTVWLTGLPCSGKTTLGKRLVEILEEAHNPACLLDADVVRRQLWPELDFSRHAREENIRRLGTLARILTAHQVIAVVASIAAYREARTQVRSLTEGFMEVFVDAPTSVCEARDVKGMWKQAREGFLKGFTGVDDPYEIPLEPEVHVKTDTMTVTECIVRILVGMHAKMDTMGTVTPAFLGARA